MKQILITCDHCDGKYAYKHRTVRETMAVLRESGWKVDTYGNVHICPTCANHNVTLAQCTKK